MLLPGGRSIFPDKTETLVEKFPKPANTDRAPLSLLIPWPVQCIVWWQRLGRIELPPEDSHIGLRIFAADEPAYVGESAEQIRFSREQAMNVDGAGERLRCGLQRRLHFLRDPRIRPKLRKGS